MTPHTRRHRLLILDDDADICTTVATIAGKAGFKTHFTTNPSEFFSIVELWKPTHVIVDLRMPGIDGVGVLMRLAMYKLKLGVIIMSGLGVRVLESAARAAGESGLKVIGILPKPFNPRRLRELLHAEITGLRLPGMQLERHPDAHTELHSDEFEVNEATLAQALQEQALEAWFQPKVDCANCQVIGFEALARWKHPVHGIIKPDRFIPIAEHCGLIGMLSRQVFESALAWFAEAFPKREKHLSLNISARLLSDADFPDWLIQLCQDYEVPPASIVLEITETSTMSDPLYMVQLLTQLRIKDFGLSIDDFGVGYSSMVQLARLPFSEIKIDKMFVTTAASSAESQKIAAAVVSLTHALGLHVTAEGVEDEWTLSFLREIGCDFAQGFLLSKPMDGESATRWYRNYRPVLADCSSPEAPD